MDGEQCRLRVNKRRSIEKYHHTTQCANFDLNKKSMPKQTTPKPFHLEHRDQKNLELILSKTEKLT